MHNNGFESTILTAHSDVDETDIVVVKKSIPERLFMKLDWHYTQWRLRHYHGRNGTMPFTFFHAGYPLSEDLHIREADVIIIHWVGASFLSLHQQAKIARTGKPIIYVCHDNGHFTGGCHVRMGCERFCDSCGMCPQLGSEVSDDISYAQLQQKKQIYQNGNITVVSPSTWMDANVARSSAFIEKKHVVIPNPIDTDLFKPICKADIRSKYGFSLEDTIIAFGAVNATKSPYKGYDQLLRMFERFSEKFSNFGPIRLLVFGSDGSSEQWNKQFDVQFMGYLDESGMVDLYNLSDVYVVPSLEDSFNNTVAESLSCETPVVSFATGGIVDIIDHMSNGYLASYGDVDDLADGLYWVLNHNQGNALGISGRKKVLTNFSYPVVAQKYQDLISEIQ